MFKIVTTDNRIVDQYAKQSHLESYVPDGVDILLINLDGCTHDMFVWNYDKGMFKWYNLSLIHI